MRRSRRREGKGEGSEVRECVKEESFGIMGIMMMGIRVKWLKSYKVIKV